MEKFLIFPTPVCKTNLKEDLNFLKSLCVPSEKTTCNLGGNNTTIIDLNNSSFSNFINKITKIANDNFKEDLALDKDLEIKKMWFNESGYKDYNPEHLHKDYTLSGIFYVDVTKDSGDLVFHRDNWAHLFTVSNTSKHHNLFTSSTQHIIPENNMLVLFPSWLVHSAYPNLSDQKRISIAFDFK